MTRTTAQRLGDITLVLAAIAALLYIGVFWNSLDIADGEAKLFWSYLGYSVSQPIYLGFAAACLFNWMDEARRVNVSYAVTGVLALCAVTTVVSILAGREDVGGQSAAATYLLQGSWLLMALAGIAVVRGFVPRALGGLVRDEAENGHAE